MAVESNSLYTTRYTNGSNYAYISLNYTITPTNPSKATVTWNVRLHTTYGYIVIGELLVKIAGNSVYHRAPEDAASATNNQLLASGTYTVEENPVDLYIGAGIYEHALNHFNSVQVQYKYDSTSSLNTLAFTNPFVVGKEHSIVNYVTPYLDLPSTLGGRQAGTCSTIKFVIGELEGTITERNDDTVVKWTVPTVLFEMYPSNKTMGGYIHCDTYRKDFEITPDGGYTYLGRMSYPLTVNFEDGPKLNPEVRDINPITLALTGDENSLVRFFSNAEFEFNATPGQGTHMVHYQVENDPYIWAHYAADMDDFEPVIEKVESGIFKFTVRDGRDYSASKTLEKKFLEYKKLTCNIWRISATADGTIEVGVGGEYWANWFGVKHNTLKVSYRYKAGSGDFSEWETFDYLTDNDDYEATITLRDLDYRVTYTFEAMVQDELMTVVSRQLPVHCVPVYDWGQNDFNVNVNLNMNHQTVLRHNHQANNLVVSSSGGFIYFRPKGTNDTSAEIKFTPQGNIELAGDIIINGQSLKSLLKI